MWLSHYPSEHTAAKCFDILQKTNLNADNDINMQNTQSGKTQCTKRINVTAARALEETYTSWRHYFLKIIYYQECWLNKNDCIRLIKIKKHIQNMATQSEGVSMLQCLWLLGYNTLNNISKLWKVAWIART